MRVDLKGTPVGVIVDRFGRPRSGVPFALTGGTLYAASSGATTQDNLVTNVDGECPGWLEPGVYTITDTTTNESVTFEVGGGAGEYAARVAAVESGQIRALVTKEAPVNPMHPQYGAKFDGVTDDTAALNAARAAIPAAGGEMLIPNGVGIVDPTAKFLLKSHMTLVGYGAGSILRMKPNSASGAGVFSIIHQVDSNLIANVTIRDVAFDGNRSNGNHGLSESIFGIHLSHPANLLIDGNRVYGLRGDGVYIAASVPPVQQPRGITIVNNFINDCGKLEAGDSGNKRMGIALLAATGFEIAGNQIRDIGSIGIDLEANDVSQAFSHGSIHSNQLRDCADWFINIDPATAATASGVTVYGNTGAGASAKGILLFGTGLTAEANTMMEVLDIGLQIVNGSSFVNVGGNIVKTTRNTASFRAPIYIDSSTFCRVANNVLLGTAGTAGVVEAAGNDNKLGPNIIEHATKYSTSGTRTSTDTTFRESITVNPATGNAVVNIGGAAAFVVSTAGNLTFQIPNAMQMFFQKSGTEFARFNASGQFAMMFPPKWAAAGMEVASVASATPAKYLKVIDSAGAVFGIPAHTL